MCATFTDDDLEKRVENANGEVIGIVTAVEEETARIEPRSGMVSSIKSALGWGRGQEPVTVRADAVGEITADTIRLEAEPDAEGDAEDADGAAPSDTAPDAADRSRDASEDSPTELDPDATGEPRADSPTGIDDATREDDGGAGIAVDEMDRGIATDESARGENADDPGYGIGTADDEPVRDRTRDRSVTDETDIDSRADDPTDATRRPDDRGDLAPRDTRGRSPDLESDRDADRGDEPTESPPSAASSGGDDGDDVENRSSPIEALDADAGDVDAASSGGPAESGDDATDLEEIDATEAMNDAERPEPVGEPGMDESVAESEAANVPDAPSDGEEVSDADASEPSRAPDSMDVAEDTADPRSASPDSHARQDVDEPASETATDERDLADEVSTGIDADSLEAVGGSDADGETQDSEDAVLADELDQGIDIESAVEGTDAHADAERDDTERDYAEEFDTSVDIETAVEPGSEPESESDDAATSDEYERRDPAAEIGSGLDAASAVDPAQKTSVEPGRESGAETGAESTSDADTETTPNTGQRIDVDTGPSTAMHRAMSEGAEQTATTDETADRSATDRDAARTQSSDRSPSGTSPVTAAFAAQRAALTGSRELLKFGLTAQRNATRVALEGPMLAQRGSLEVAEAAALGYLNAVGSMTTARERENQPEQAFEQSLEKTITAIEETRSRIDDDDLARELAAHLDELRTLRAERERPEQRADRVAALLERQTELLERCQRHLEESRSK